MNFLSSLFRKKEAVGCRKQRIKMARELHGQAIKYVTERRNDNDDVIGRGGSLTLRGEEFLVFSSGEIIMRTNAAEMDASYLMSGDGVVITAPNLDEGGTVHTIIAHFVYYRK